MGIIALQRIGYRRELAKMPPRDRPTAFAHGRLGPTFVRLVYDAHEKEVPVDRIRGKCDGGKHSVEIARRPRIEHHVGLNGVSKRPVAKRCADPDMNSRHTR